MADSERTPIPKSQGDTYNEEGADAPLRASDGKNASTNASDDDQDTSQAATGADGDDDKDKLGSVRDSEKRGDTDSSSPAAAPTERKGDKDDSKPNSPKEAATATTGKSQGRGGKGKGRFGGRRRLIFGGASAMSIGAMFVGFTFISGPLEFIHFSKVLQRHFSGIDDIMDDQAMSRVRYRRRLGVGGNKAADIIERQLNKAGYVSHYDASGYFDGFEIDPGKVSASQLESFGGHLQINADGKQMLVLEPGSNFRRRSLMNNVLKAAKIRFIPSKVSSRIMRTRGGVSFHILGNVDRKANTRLNSYADEVLKKFTDYFRSGEDPINVRASGETEDDAGNELSDEERAASQGGADDFNESVDGVRTDTTDARVSSTAADVDLKARGGSASNLMGYICTVKGIGDQYQKLLYVAIALPLARLGVGFISIGSQIMSNDDVNWDELSVMARMLHNAKSPWASARSVQYELGRNPVGPDMPKSAQPSRIGTKPAIFRVVDALPIGTACRINNNAIGSLAISFATGGFGDLAIDGIMSGLQALGVDPVGDGIASLVSWAVGKPLKAVPTGALLGNYANYGALLGSFNQFLGIGARVLTDEEGFQVRQARLAADKIDFENKPLATRLFDPTESRSVVGQAFLGAPKTGSEAFASLSNALWKFPSTLASVATKLTFKHAGAAPGSYDYNMDYVGFTNAEQNDARFINPYDIDAAVEPQLAELNEKYGKCFGTTVDPTSKQVITAEVPNYFEDSFEPCRITPVGARAGEYVGFTQYRFYLLGKLTERSVECWGGIESSCKEAQGKVRAPAGPALAQQPPGAGGGAIVGNPYTDSTGVPCAAGTRDIGTSTGYSAHVPFPVRLCSVSNIPSSGRADSPGDQFSTPGGDGHAIVNSRASGAWYQLAADAAAAGISITATSSFRSMPHQEYLWRENGMNSAYVASPGGSSHQAGVALDLGGGMGVKGGATCGSRATAPSSQAWVWMRDNAARYGFRQYAREAWHWDALPGSTRC